MSTIPWYENRIELVAFVRVMCMINGLGDADELINVFALLEKPWKYEAEYQRWVSLGRPNDEEYFEPDDEAEDFDGCGGEKALFILHGTKEERAAARDATVDRWLRDAEQAGIARAQQRSKVSK